ncbi:MAG: hypothetical protein GY853_12290 [PVC group bacterium]|nr:hypothetical protein [PVC group bacterium]
MQFKTKNKREAFTLTEVLAGIVLLALAIIPMANYLTQSFVISVREERITKTIFLAERKMEELKGKIIYDFNTDRDAKATAFTDPGYGNYKYIVDDQTIATKKSGLKQIQVQVWYDEDGDKVIDSDEESVTLNTKIAQR